MRRHPSRHRTPEWGVVQPGQVLNVFGDVTGDGIPRGTIDTITFTVGLVPGEKSVNMENVTIVYADAIRTERPGTGCRVPWRSTAGQLGNPGGAG